MVVAISLKNLSYQGKKKWVKKPDNVCLKINASHLIITEMKKHEENTAVYFTISTKQDAYQLNVLGNLVSSCFNRNILILIKVYSSVMLAEKLPANAT